MQEWDVLEGLDDIPWEELEAANPPGGIPRLLRAVMTGAETEPGGEDRVFDSLSNSLCHQGTLYSATVHAVPFLARMAAAGVLTVDMLDLLAWCSACDVDRESQFGDLPPGAVRAAIADEAEGIVPLLTNSDEDVRVCAARTLAECRVPDHALPALLELWKTETSTELLIALADRGDLGLAFDLAIAGLTEPVAPGVRQKAVWSAGTLADEYRIPIPALAVALAGLIGDRDRGSGTGPDAGVSAILQLRELGPVPEVADTVFAAADVRGEDSRADHSLAYLFALGDPRDPGLLARDQRVRPRAVEAARPGTSRVGPPLPGRAISSVTTGG
ncbi:MAG: hypothetical protein ACRDN0_11930 [Trebonia sp.]